MGLFQFKVGWFKIKARTNLGSQNYIYLSARVTKGFHGAVFKSFTGKKEAEVWLKEHKDTVEKEKGLENLGSEENNVDIEEGENVKHCTDDCKYDGRDEEYGGMIECCLC